jgi:hypothetical protein
MQIFTAAGDRRRHLAGERSRPVRVLVPCLEVADQVPGTLTCSSSRDLQEVSASGCGPGSTKLARFIMLARVRIRVHAAEDS